MYYAEENEMVIVTAPIMFILADNPAHSDLCGILGLRTVYPCRKCYYRQVVKPNSTNYTLPISAVIGPNHYRTKEDYRIAPSDPNSMIYNAVNFTVTAKTLSYRNIGTEQLLELNSYDPAQDTPVEILHTVLLGVAKYLSVDEAAMYLIAEMHNFDVTTTNLAPYCGKPKTHLLRHLKDDLIRFGCALHFETEKGEQFNKFLRTSVPYQQEDYF
ncbi:unnamed protein product [Mucor hiemalis]